MKIGIYKRVSTDAQELAAQEHSINAWLVARGLTATAEFSDKQSGKHDKRPGLDALCAAIERGDVDTVLVYRLDRLSRKAVTALSLILDWIKADIGFYAVDQPMLSLGRENPIRLTIAALFSELAQMEREAIVARVRSGIDAARKRGQRFGPPPKLAPGVRHDVKTLRTQGLSFAAIGEKLGISPTTAWKLSRR